MKQGKNSYNVSLIHEAHKYKRALHDVPNLDPGSLRWSNDALAEPPRNVLTFTSFVFEISQFTRRLENSLISIMRSRGILVQRRPGVSYFNFNRRAFANMGSSRRGKS